MSDFESGRMASNPWARRDRGHRVSYRRRSGVVVRVGAPTGAVAAASGTGASRRAAGRPGVLPGARAVLRPADRSAVDADRHLPAADVLEDPVPAGLREPVSG